MIRFLADARSVLFLQIVDHADLQQSKSYRDVVHDIGLLPNHTL